MKELFKKLGIKTVNSKLYKTAFTHTSYSNEHDNVSNYERLEFLGDAVLELILSDFLYNEKSLKEGSMTKMRANYVCEEACATYARELGFNDYILLGSGEVDANDTILADVFEAFVGACYLDQGFDFANDMVLNIIVKYIDKDTIFIHDYKSELQELVQTVKKSVTYDIINEKGPAHNKTFTCQVVVDGVVMGMGIGSSKKQAEQLAAREALSKKVSG